MSSVQQQVKATGTVVSDEAFHFLESSTFSPADVVRVLKGEAVGCIFRGIIKADVCREVADNFRNHPLLRRRDDDVPAFFLGTYHYRKALNDYLDEAATYHDTLHDIFHGSANVFEQIMSAIGTTLAEEQVGFRVAAHDGRHASEFVMRSWSGTGEYSLEPHDDGAQLQFAGQRGFEIQDISPSPVVAFNMCLENSGAGELHYWNLQPDDATRIRLGLQETGYPYPLAVLEGLTKLVVPVHAGDVYFFNGALIHAVAAQAGASGRRSTISGLMGFVSPNTVVYWS